LTTEKKELISLSESDFRLREAAQAKYSRE